MARFIAGLTALFVYGLLGAALAESAPFNAPEARGDSARAIRDVGGAESAMPLAISNEEAARREKVCEQLWSNCKERCINWKLKGKKLADCHDMCRANFDDCIADIK